MDIEARMLMGNSSDDKTRATGRRHSGKKAFILTLCVLLFLLLMGSYLVRTSAYLHVRLEPRLEQLGAKLGGRFTFTGIHAMGLTGIILDDVTFMPDGMTADKALRFDSVTIYPALRGMFFGDLNASAIEAKGFRARLDVGEEDESHLTWMRRQRAMLASAASPVQGAVATGERSRLPLLRCILCHTDIVHPKGTLSLDIDDQTLQFDDPEHPWHSIRLTGPDVRACAAPNSDNVRQYTGDSFCVDASADGISFDDDSIVIDSTRVAAHDLPNGRIGNLAVAGLSFRADDAQRFLHVDSGSADFELRDIPYVAGRYSLAFDNLEVLQERVSHRLGFGVSIRTPDDISASIYGGLDKSSRTLGLTVNSGGLDFAPLLRHAARTQDIDIQALPLSGTVEILADFPNQSYLANIRGTIGGAAASVPVLARAPLTNIRADVEMTVDYDRPSRTVMIDIPAGHLGTIGFGGHLLHAPSYIVIDGASGSAPPPGDDAPMHFEAEIDISGDSATFLPSLPKNFAPALSGYKLEGPFALGASLRYDTDALDDLQLNVNLDLDDVKTLAFDPRSNFDLIKTNNFLIKVNAATVPKLIGPREASWASFYDIPRETAYAFIASEDTRFFTHPGMDLRAIRASLIADLKAGKFVRGGSTISQQVVKNLFLNHDKTMSRKFQEAFLTWQMEKTLPKLRIFELYLNLAHWARDTYGIRDAARFYFQKNVRDLTLRESLFLASILPNPVIFGKQYADNKLSPSRLQKMINVATNLFAAKRINKATLDETTALIRENRISDRPRPYIP